MRRASSDATGPDAELAAADRRNRRDRRDRRGDARVRLRQAHRRQRRRSGGVGPRDGRAADRTRDDSAARCYDHPADDDQHRLDRDDRARGARARPDGDDHADDAGTNADDRHDDSITDTNHGDHDRPVANHGDEHTNATGADHDDPNAHANHADDDHNVDAAVALHALSDTTAASEHARAHARAQASAGQYLRASRSVARAASGCTGTSGTCGGSSAPATASVATRLRDSAPRS
ncbi:MAG: hypothetical protein QOI48_2738 [Solirubrobacteraceae bacterium]|nr:hypothetical protein [Solirubrobacteraceae bacterium]